MDDTNIPTIEGTKPDADDAPVANTAPDSSAEPIETKADDLTGNAPEAINLTDEEKAAAQKEGATEAVKEAAKGSYQSLTDGSTPGDPAPTDPWAGSDEISLWSHLIELGVDEFKKVVTAAKSEVPLNKVAGLLKLERAGKNRTPYVDAMVKKLGVKSVYEVTDAGPDYTNDVSQVTKL